MVVPSRASAAVVAQGGAGVDRDPPASRIGASPPLRAGGEACGVSCGAGTPVRVPPRERPGIDLVALYLDRAGTVPLLDRAGEARLGARISSGRAAAAACADPGALSSARRAELDAAVADGRAAFDELVCANLRLVVHVAKRYQRPDRPLLDVIQDGNLGLLRAAEKFDFSRGFKFSTYAMWWIRQGIDRGDARTGSPIRIPVHARERRRIVDRAVRDLEAAGVPFDVDDVAATASLPPEEVVAALSHPQVTVSLDAHVGADDDDVTLGALVAVADTADPSTDAVDAAGVAELRRALDRLDGRHREVLVRRFGLGGRRPETYREIAEDLGVSAQRVQGMQRAALARLASVPALAATG